MLFFVFPFISIYFHVFPLCFYLDFIFRFSSAFYSVLPSPFFFLPFTLYAPSSTLYNIFMPLLTAVSSAYDKLLVSVHATMASGLLAAQKALEYQRLKTYWHIGQQLQNYMDSYLQGSLAREEFYQRLSRDISAAVGSEVSYDTLRRSVQFSRQYPEFPDKTSLTFSHYLVLLRVSDPRVRNRLEEQAMQEGLSVSQVKAEVAQLVLTGKKVLPKVAALECQRGEPYIYAIQGLKDISGAKMFRVDCGFKIQRDIPAGNTSFEEGGAIVRVTKSGENYTLRRCQKQRDKRYTYSAVVTKIIDGDTFDATVDVGFNIWIHDRFRLRGINTPELKTDEGGQAKAFLVRFLENCPRIVIRTTKEGVYGRWLADVFALKGEADPRKIAAQGEYLNQTLLDQGLAALY